MKTHTTRLVRSISALLAITLLANLIVVSQTDQQKAWAKDIKDAVGNGIFVDTAQVYDDSALQLMLNSARSRLATLQSLDQTGLLTRIGAVTGASLDQQAISAQVNGPSLPGTVTTANGATGSTQTINAANGQTTTTNAGLPVQNVVTTAPAMTASAPPLPTLSTALPTSGFNISSIDALNEMMQLTYEIANLQLLLEGSLSDRYVQGQRFIKPRTTIGFPITISNQERYKDAVAIVEVEAISPPAASTYSTEPPSVTALLPREKTYNVASISDKMTSIGGGVVSQVISGGFSFLRGRKSYYLVQDQDTVAMMQPGPAATTVFAWQFRPVLGQQYVRSGMKQTFVQLAVPLRAGAGCFGQVKIKTYWQHYDRKRGVLKDVIAESIQNQTAYYNIPNFDQTPVPRAVRFDDLGSGMLQASIRGQFQTGTSIRVGQSIFRDGTPGFTSDLSQIRFTVSASEIAKHRAFMVSRDGKETEIVDAADPIVLPAVPAGCSLATAVAQAHVSNAATAKISAFDNSNSLLTISFTSLQPLPTLDKYVVVVGGKVFGLSDAPIERDPTAGQEVLKVVIPNSLLQTAPAIEVKPLFWRDDYSVKITNVFKAESTAEKIVSLGPNAAGDIVYLLYGNRLANARILVPSGIALNAFNGYTNTDALQSFILPAALAKTQKNIVLVKNSTERPITVAMPATGEAKPSLSFAGRIVMGRDDIVVQGDSLDKLKTVKFKDKALQFTVSADKKTVTISNLVQSGVTAVADSVKLEFDFGELGKNSLEIEVISGKIEMVTRN